MSKPLAFNIGVKVAVQESEHGFGQKLTDMLQTNAVGYGLSTLAGMPASRYLDQDMTPSMHADNAKLTAGFPGLKTRKVEGPRPSAGYAPSINEVHHTRALPPGILAHELGHAGQGFLKNKALTKAYLATLQGAPLAASLVPFMSNDNTAQTIANVGTAAAVPSLLTELHASLKGRNLMGNALGRKSWKPFIGLPTYLAAAAMPQISNYLREKRTQ